MSDPFVGEIRMFGGNYAPQHWALCNGQILAIAQNQALFSLIGTTFGGNGVQTFQLPNLQGRLAIGEGQGLGLTNRVIGEVSGSESVTLTQATMPIHTHLVNASTVSANKSAIDSTELPATLAAPQHFYVLDDGTTPPPSVKTLASGSIGAQGGNQPHNNMMPSLCVSFIISLYGAYPSRN